MKIVKIEAIPFAIPYRKPLRFASGEVHVADHVLVRVHTDDGVVGLAEAPPRPYTYGETQESIVAVVEQAVRPRADRAVAARPRGRPRPAGPHRRQPGREGRLDMAIWDALGRTLGLPVTAAARRLDRSDARVPHGRLRSDAEMVAEAERLRDELRHHAPSR